MTILAEHVEFLSVSWLRSHGVRILVVLIVAALVTLLARLAVRRLGRKLEGVPSLTQELDLQRSATITNTVSGAVQVLIWTIAAFILLDEFGINLAPLIAGAGIAGVALGFGAQSLVRDTLAGLFILVENQLGVGDVIELQTTGGPISGRVEGLTLRATTLRAFDGTLHTVPNGNVHVVSNKSRGWARAIVDVRVAADQDVGRVRSILDELFEELREGEDFRDAIMTGPSVLGIETLADHAIVVRVVADTRPSRRWDVERQLRERIAGRLNERGIRLPFPATPFRQPGPDSAGT